MKSVFITGASGTGKSTTFNALLSQGFRPSPNHLTRTPRPGEVQGVDAHFVTEAAFTEGIAKGEYFETSLSAAEHGGVYYGSPRQWVVEIQNDENIIAMPSNVVVVSGLTAVLESMSVRQKLIWCNLHAPTEVRRERICHRITDSAVLHARLFSGVSHGIHEAADINIDTAVTPLEDVISTVLERTS